MPDVLNADQEAIVNGSHGDPFSVLGLHRAKDGQLVLRAFQPHARAVRVIDKASNRPVADLEKTDAAGFFAGRIPRRQKPFAYLLELETDSGKQRVEDAYGFPPLLGELDTYYLAEGKHRSSFECLGAHLRELEGVHGVAFAVWAPNAKRVSVVGDFNNWDGRRHVMRNRRECGVWEIFIPDIGADTFYKYEIVGQKGRLLPLKADPYGFYQEKPPGFASVVYPIEPFPRDESKVPGPASVGRDQPISIYEVHLGSWRRGDGNRYLTYRELADELVPYVRDMGYTHVEFLPVCEHPFDGSWGYQPLGLFAPTSRYGTPDDFQHLVRAFHEAGIGVFLDWVPGHFPADEHGLAFFDGTALYEHMDPRKGRHREWGTLIYNFGRREVANFLISNALFWVQKYGIQGLRVDAVASILYLDYDREAGEWEPNEYGGNENLEAIDFLRQFNEAVYAAEKETTTVAEESTAWPMVSRPTYLGGLGFGYKWNMGWMNDTLSYISHDPVHRRYHHGQLTFGLIYAFNENFVLPISHDEVVHGKRSLLEKMPGDDWRKFANVRAYLGFMFTHPGKKLLFMGNEIAQRREWNHDAGLDWHLLDDPRHKAVQDLVRDLNRLYRERAALHKLDCESQGFEWIDSNDDENSVLSYIRRSGDAAEDFVVVLCNFTPMVRQGYRVGVPMGGAYREILNTDSEIYGGSNVGNMGSVDASDAPMHGRSHSLSVTIPPLATVILEPDQQ